MISGSHISLAKFVDTLIPSLPCPHFVFFSPLIIFDNPTDPNICSLRNGTTVLCDIVFGAVVPNRPRSILDLRTLLGEEEELSFERLRTLDASARRRRHHFPRQQRRAATDVGARDMGG